MKVAATPQGDKLRLVVCERVIPPWWAQTVLDRAEVERVRDRLTEWLSQPKDKS